MIQETRLARRQELLRTQQGRCAACGLDITAKGKSRRDSISGLFLCSRCMLGLGMLRRTEDKVLAKLIELRNQ